MPVTFGSTPASCPIRIRGPRTGSGSASSCRASGTWSRPSSAGAGDAARLFIVGGDCTAHAGAMAGLRAADPGRRLAIAWFDAHGDFNTPDTTPSGNVWGMPFAMLCGRGDPDLVRGSRWPDRHGAGCGAVWRPGARRGRIAVDRGVADRALRRRHAGDICRPRRGRRVGRDGRLSRRRRSTWPSTWIVSMPPEAGR